MLVERRGRRRVGRRSIEGRGGRRRRIVRGRWLLLLLLRWWRWLVEAHVGVAGLLLLLLLLLLRRRGRRRCGPEPTAPGPEGIVPRGRRPEEVRRVAGRLEGLLGHAWRRRREV